jgi:hypothetical protein
MPKLKIFAFLVIFGGCAFLNQGLVSAAPDPDANKVDSEYEGVTGTTKCEVATTIEDKKGKNHTYTPMEFLAFPLWNRGLTCKVTAYTDGSTAVSTVISQNTNGIAAAVWTVVLNCLEILIQVAGILAVVFLMYNGFQYLTSGGSSDKISKAKTGMLQSMVGLFIAVSAAALIGFIVGRIN